MITVLITCVCITLARITDITLDTVRTVAIVQGRRSFAALLGFFEAFIYIVAVSRVLQGKFSYMYGTAYALGFALGTYLGITLDQILAFGEQVINVFTRKGTELVPVLRSEGFRVTEFTGQGRDGPVQSLLIQVARKSGKRLAQRLRELDPHCFLIINDIRTALHSGVVAENKGA